MRIQSDLFTLPLLFHTNLPSHRRFNTTSVSFVPLSQQRIDFIRDQLKRQPDLDPRTQANLKEVIRVYSTGELDLARRSKPWELVAFFDGQMKSAGWETIDYEQFWGETVADWKAKNPDAHIWIETVSILVGYGWMGH